jgi:hypothetical protein
MSGWNNGLCQDYDASLGKWFADRLGARQQLRVTINQGETMKMKYKTVVVLVVEHEGELPDLGNMVAQRAYTLDKVSDVQYAITGVFLPIPTVEAKTSD